MVTHQDGRSSKIEIHFGLPLLAGYRNWQLKKYTDYPAYKDGYLWVSEAEWIPPDEILEHNLGRPNMIPGLIPFAFTGGGDNWCWNTQFKNGEAEYDVLCCWHDDELADAFAPTFPAWFYRNCLDYASGRIANNVDEIRQGRDRLRRWSERLSEIYPGAWAEHLLSLSETQPFEYKNPKMRVSVPMSGFITAMEVERIVAEQFGQRYLEEKIEWGTWSE